MNVEAGFFESKDEQDYLVLFFCITTYLCACLLEGSGFFFSFYALYIPTELIH